MLWLELAPGALKFLPQDEPAALRVLGNDSFEEAIIFTVLKVGGTQLRPLIRARKRHDLPAAPRFVQETLE